MNTETSTGGAERGDRAFSKAWKALAVARPILGRKAVGAILVGLAVLASACRDLGRRYWVPSADQREQAERIAKFHVYTNLSDQARSGNVEKIQLGPDGLPLEYPITFTIGTVPYSRYRTRIWGAIQRGRRVVYVQYVDPSRHPDWQQRKELRLDFPEVFEVVVDLAAARVLQDSHPSSPRR
jgi:hypothetical protein